ncbi:MAG TPA: EAL domain-containing protein [Longilinea sp.]|nr:EAL domain-containing protein [Longilinea sp.]
MILRRQVALVFLIVFFISAVGVLLAGKFLLLDTYQDFETRELDQNLNWVQSRLRLEWQDTAEAASDWAQNSEACRFVQGSNLSFVDTDLTLQNFQTNRVNWVGYYGLDGYLIYTQGYDLTNGNGLEMDEALQQVMDAAARQVLPARMGYDETTPVYLDRHGLASVSAVPILHDNNSGPACGILVVVQFIDETTLMESELGGRYEVHLWPLDHLNYDDTTGELDLEHPQDLPAENAGSVEYDLFTDEDNSPIAVIELRSLDQQYNRKNVYNIFFFLVVMGLGALTLWIVIGFFIDRRILRRLSQVGNKLSIVSDTADLSTRVPVKGADEVSVLTETINNMLSNLETSTGALHASQERFQLTMQGVNDGLWEWDVVHDQFFFSPRVYEITGYSEGEITPNKEKLVVFFHPDDRPTLRAYFKAYLDGHSSTLMCEFRLLHKDGTYHWYLFRGAAERGEDDKPVRMAGSITDITFRKQVEEELRHGALHDALTGLPNQTLAMDRLQHILNASPRHKIPGFAVMMIDVDRFKLVNDSLGHSVGDIILKEVARRLRICLRPADTVARMSGDEFLVVVEDIHDSLDVIQVANRILNEFKLPFNNDSNRIFLTASIGIAVGKAGDYTRDEILRDADIALLRAKMLGKARFEIFDPDLQEQAMKHIDLQRGLNEAVEKGQFKLLYQPIFSLRGHELAGFEALLRWQHPQRGMIEPDDFIGLAEETGLIIQIGEWVISESTRCLGEWIRRFDLYEKIVMAVNISGKHFSRNDLVEHIRIALDKSGILAENLSLEMTESALIEQPDAAAAILHDIRDLGVHLAVDDFGTGYSSLSYLELFPIDYIKIDRGFIHNLGSDNLNTKIVNSIITLTHQLGAGTVAEGVETAVQEEALIALNCDLAQGFLYYPPLTEGEVLKLLRKLAAH